MSENQPSICPICKSKNFSTERRGLVFKSRYYICRNCETVLKEQKEFFQIEHIGEEYSNLRPYVQGDKISDNDLADYPSMSDDDLDKISKAESPLYEDAAEGFNELLENFELPIFLKRGEVALIGISNISLFEERSTRVSSGSRAGVRVMKGVYISQSITGPEYESILKELDSGSLVITNKRFVFTGAKRNVDQSLGKITTVTIFPDGVSIARSNKQKTEYFTGSSYWPLAGSYIKGIVTQYHQ